MIRMAAPVYIFVAVLASVMAFAAEEQTAPRVLLFTKSAGFEHSVIKETRRQPVSHAEGILRSITDEMGAVLESTKDGTRISKETLSSVDVVIFYTSGNLTEKGNDGHPPVTPEGMNTLFDWIRGGGGFIGLHAATDTFKSEGGATTAFTEMIGGEFVTHGEQFKAAVRKVSPDHAAVRALPDVWTVQDEWYMFDRLNKEHMHVLALLETGGADNPQKMYQVPDYPIIWCRSYGDGRVLYNGLGHREDVWEHTVFRQMLRDHILWAQGRGDAHTEPNYAEVVPE